MTSLESLKKLQEVFLKVPPEQFIFTRYHYEGKYGKGGNLMYLADTNNIKLEEDKITNYLLFGSFLKVSSSTLQEKCPGLLINASYQEVSEALDFVIKNYKKIC